MYQRHKKYENYHSKPHTDGLAQNTSKKTSRHNGLVSKLWRQNMLVFSVTLLVFSIFSQAYLPMMDSRKAELSPQMRQLTGESRDDTGQYLKSEKGGGFSFAVPETSEGGQSEHTGRVADAYTANLPADAKEGITVTEKSSKIAVTLIPDFYAQTGQKIDGDHIVYPTGPDKLVYTLKYNGLKEDIIVPKFRKNELSYSFKLRLPAGVEARLDDQGNIGIYSSDPTLFGDISFGSDEDKQKIENARQNGEKNNLVMTIPFPVIKDASGQEYTDRSSFELGEMQQTETLETRSDLPTEIPKSLIINNDYKLTIKSVRLSELSYPIAIDPTVQVTNSSDFSGVDAKDGVSIDSASNLIKRTSLTGAYVGAWSGDNTDQPFAGASRAAFYNGYLYLVQSAQAIRYATVDESTGDVGAFSSTIMGLNIWNIEVYNGYFYQLGVGNHPGVTNYYSVINPNGSLGTATLTTSWTANRGRPGTAIHNGYLYRVGGHQSGTTYFSDTEVAPLNTDGSIGSFSAGTSIATARSFVEAVTYNDTLYIVGGTISGSTTGSIEYAKIGAGGVLGSWQTASVSVSNRFQHKLVVNAGYLYVIGGWNGTDGSALNTVLYAEIYGDGSLGAFKSANGFATARRSHGGVAAYNRLYIAGGTQGTNITPAQYVDIQHVSIKPAGWTNTHAASTSFTTGRNGHTSVAYNGYVYVIGGGNGGSYYNDVQYAPINTNGTLGSWTTDGGTSFSNARRYHASVVINGYIYVMGGFDGLTYYNNVQYAPLNSDGSVGAWASTSSFTNNRQGLAAVEYKGYVYLAGGYNGTSNYNDVLYAQVNTNGTLGVWADTGNTFTTSRRSFGAAVFNGYLYIAGGLNADEYDDVQFAAVNSNGTLGSFSATTSFPTGRFGHNLIQHKGNLYIIGGSDGAVRLDSVYFAKLNTDGTVGSWTQANNLTKPRGFASSVVYNDYLYTLGGGDGASQYSDTEYALINNGGSGSVDSWTLDTGGDFSTARKGHAAVAHKGYLYVIGGCTDATCDILGETTTSIQYAPINNDGSVGAWSATTTTFSTAREDHYAFIYNDKIYVAGGRTFSGGTNLNDIQYNTLQSNGDITGSWTTNGINLPSSSWNAGFALNGNNFYRFGGSGSQTASHYATISQTTGAVGSWSSVTALPDSGRYAAKPVAHNGYMYLLGGTDGTNERTTVYSTPISSDGSLGSWTLVSSAPLALRVNSAFAINGFLYLIGGWSAAAGFRNYFVAAPIGAQGTVGSWTVRSAALSGISGHAFGASAYHNGIMYSTGGRHNTTEPHAETRYGKLNTIPRIGSFTKRYDFGTGVRPTKLITRGAKQAGATVNVSTADSAACGATAYDTAVTSNNIGYNGANALNINIGATQSLARCLVVRYTIDDTQSGVFPDAGNESTVTDFDLYLTANPGQRLRGGRTFINGTDRGLDAAPQ